MKPFISYILYVVGQKPKQQIAGFMLATGFISMWVSNTATAIMMLPIGMSVVSLFANADSGEVKRYATALLLVGVIAALNFAAVSIRNHLREKYKALEN